MSFKFSLEKSLRLLNKNDFQNLRTGSRFFISDVLLFYTKENNKTFDRLGVAVTKKYGNAVKRNKIKRILRENFRVNKEFFDSNDILISLNLRKIKKEKISHTEVCKRIPQSFFKAYSNKFKR